MTRRRRPDDCPFCGGAKFVYRLCSQYEQGAVDTHRGWAKLVPCRACNGEDKRLLYLQKISGLRQEELQCSFDTYWLDLHGVEAVQACRDVLEFKGWLTLAGPYGTGKSFLLCALVNEAMARGKLAVHVTMPRLLEHLRQAYKPGFEVDHDQFWENIVSAHLLCIDQAETYNATPWAEEKIMMLSEGRYRDHLTHATVLACNDFELLPGHLKSRAMDRRFARLVATRGDARTSARREAV